MSMKGMVHVRFVQPGKYSIFEAEVQNAGSIFNIQKG
jgi:hypothetical protein